MPSGLLGKSQAYLDMLDRYLTLMEKFSRLTEDPAASGSAAVPHAREILTSDGDTNKAIEYFTQLLPEVKNGAVQRHDPYRAVRTIQARWPERQSLGATPGPHDFGPA